MKLRALGARSLVDHLESEITAGRMPLGFKLPAERMLSEQFQLSRGSVRRALLWLKDQGYVDQKVGSGTYVVWQPPVDPLQAVLPTSTIDADSVQVSPYELMEARRLIEPLMPQLIVRKATAHNFARMRECLDKSEQASSIEEFEHWDGELHRELANATHNSFFHEILRLTNMVREQGEWGRLKKKSLTAERRKTYEQQHRALVDALQDRDADKATKLLKTHLEQIQRNLFDV